MTPDRDRDFVRRHLQDAVPPWTATAPHADLWPRLLRRLDEAPPRFGWLESVLVALVLLSALFLPDSVTLLLWNL